MKAQHRRVLDFNSIKEQPFRKKFQILMNEEFKNQLNVDSQEKCIFSGKINIKKAAPISISLYKTGSCVINASVKKVAQDIFNKNVDIIIKIAKASENVILIEKNLFSTHVQYLLKHLNNIDLDNELERWMVPILSTIIIEMLLIRKFQNLKYSGAEKFKMEQLSKKLEILHKKNPIPFYDRIHEIRDKRNTIIHDCNFDISNDLAKDIQEIMNNFCEVY